MVNRVNKVPKNNNAAPQAASHHFNSPVPNPCLLHLFAAAHKMYKMLQPQKTSRLRGSRSYIEPTIQPPLATTRLLWESGVRILEHWQANSPLFRTLKSPPNHEPITHSQPFSAGGEADGIYRDAWLSPKSANDQHGGSFHNLADYTSSPHDPHQTQ